MENMICKMSLVQPANMVRMIVDLTKSSGNMLADVSGKKYLDMFGHIGSLPLGYNHPRLLDCVRRNASLAAHRAAVNVITPLEHVDQLHTVFQKTKPAYFPSNFYLHLDSTGSCAVENALKACYKYRVQQLYGEPDESRLLQAMENHAPRLKFLSFQGGFHGRTIGALSTSRSNAHHKVDFPAFNNWEALPFPKYKYPLHLNSEFNQHQDERCLQVLEDTLKDCAGKVAGLIVEPIQAEGGDVQGSNLFFRGVRRLTAMHGVPMIMDEVQTGLGSTGKLFAHQHWVNSPEDAPDMVTFSKKFQIAGFYAKPCFRAEDGCPTNSTWAGDPFRGELLREIIDIVQEENLIHKAEQTGEALKERLQHLPNIRGKGAFLAFDLDSPTSRDKFLEDMQANGVLVGGCGLKSIRLRPPLTFHKEEEIDFFVNTVRTALAA
jgi:4-aminobutyrate aminotransferase/(S)-3-amino-2-methylpropionate transaminase